MNRTDQREWALKLVYENFCKRTYDFDVNELLESHCLDVTKSEYLIDILTKLKENYNHLTEKLEEGTKIRNLKNFSLIDKSILYVSLTEIDYLGLHESVAINEAVKLAKKYSTENAYKPINAILGQIIRSTNEQSNNS